MATASADQHDNRCDPTNQREHDFVNALVITHADPRCTYGCVVLNLTIARLLNDELDPISRELETVRSDGSEELNSALEAVANVESSEPLPMSGYVVHTLRTALADALRADSVEDVIVTRSIAAGTQTRSFLG